MLLWPLCLKQTAKASAVVGQPCVSPAPDLLGSGPLGCIPLPSLREEGFLQQQFLPWRAGENFSLTKAAARLAQGGGGSAGEGGRVQGMEGVRAELGLWKQTGQ